MSPIELSCTAKKGSVNAIFHFKLFRVQTDDKSWFRRQILVPVWLAANFLELPPKFFSSHKQNKRGKQNTSLTLISTLKNRWLCKHRVFSHPLSAFSYIFVFCSLVTSVIIVFVNCPHYNHDDQDHDHRNQISLGLCILGTVKLPWLNCLQNFHLVYRGSCPTGFQTFFWDCLSSNLFYAYYQNLMITSTRPRVNCAEVCYPQATTV